MEKINNTETKWLQELKSEQNKVKMRELEITVEIVEEQIKGISNWKAPRRDSVYDYWTKQLPSLHEGKASQLNKIKSDGNRLPEWMISGRTILCQRGLAKDRRVDNYRLISCLLLMCKLLTGMIAEEMYSFIKREKDCWKGSCGTRNKLMVNKIVLKDCKQKKINL